MGDGYDVFVVTDASGGVSVEAHERAIQRLVQAGAVPVTWMGVLSEWQRDWAREATVPALAEIMHAHGGSTGTSIAWEFQLLTAGAKKK
jgi:nicotinamidase-related amidase